MTREEKLHSIQDAKDSSGKNAYIKYLSGEKIGRREAILAHCADCCGMYDDGRKDCELSDCPLYPFMPYTKTARNSLQRV